MTASKNALVSVLVLTSALTLTGCGDGAESNSESETAIQPDGGPYTYVEELRDAFIEAGGECEDDDWQSHGYAGGTIICNDSDSLSVFDDPDDIQSYREDRVRSAPLQKVEYTWLEGENWVVHTFDENEAALQEVLGGEIETFTVGPAR